MALALSSSIHWAVLQILGMLGGLALLGVLILISKAITEFGFEAIFKAVLSELKKKGTSAENIINQVENYPISGDLKRTLKEHVSKWG